MFQRKYLNNYYQKGLFQVEDKLNLVPAIKEIKAKIQEKEAQFELDIKPYKDSLEQLRKLNQACEYCNGLGKKLRSRSCAEDDRPDPNNPMDYVSCSKCGGTGYKSKPYEGDDFP